MIGTVHVMEKDAYQRWLAGPNAGLPPAVQGAKLFEELNCISCHRAGANQRGPMLEGLYGKPVELKGGANILIFPELQSANTAYKLIWRLAGAEAIGPILLGMARPVHVLQKGVEVSDIVSMAAICVVDA